MKAGRFILVSAAALAIEARAAQGLELARRAVEDGFFDYAVRVLERAPESEERSLLLGISYIHLPGKLEGAVELLEGRLEGAYKAEALFWMSVARLGLAEMEPEEEKRTRLYADAAEGFAEVPRTLTDPKKIYEARHLRAKALLGLGEFDESVAELRSCLEQERRAPVESDLVSALYRARRYREAASAARRFAQVWPESPDLAQCLFTGAQSHYVLGDWGRAEELYRLALKKARNERAREEARYGLAWALWKEASGLKGEVRQEALEECARRFRALTASSSPMRARVSRYRLASVLLGLGRHEDAIERLSGLVDSEDLGPWALGLTGKAYLEQGEFLPARNAFLSILAAKELPRSLFLEAHEGIADSHMREGREKKSKGAKREAVDAFERASAAYGKMVTEFGRDPLARARARHGRSRAAVEAGNHESAADILSSMASAREIPPGMRLSELYLEEGRVRRKWALAGAESQRSARLESASKALGMAIEIEDRQELALPALIERARVEVDFAGLERESAHSHLAAAVDLLREALSFAGAPRELEAEARRELGNCLLLQDRPQGALEEFKTARKLVNDAAGMLGTARALARLDPVRADEAYGDFLATFRKSELRSYALFEHGSLRRRMGMPLDASRDLEAVARLYPRFERRAEAWLLAAESAREAGDLGRAAQLYDECRLFVGERAAEARLKRAEVLLEMGKAEVAASLARGLGARGFLVEGMAFEKLRRWRAALVSLGKAARAEDAGTASAANLAAGRVFLRTGDYERARDSFLSAIYLASRERRRSVAEEAVREAQKLAPRGRIAELTESLEQAGGM